MDLKEYQRKRRFDETPEPHGTPGPSGTPRSGTGRPHFVVQEHHARRVHWDLRLEMEGILRSWAIPKGPSLDPADKRLAVLVEDHPLEYGGFEGIIPEGHYGAGTVMLWDQGEYECREGDPAEAFRRGKLTLDFFGSKLRGEFHFVRTKRNEGRDWLLFKGKDEYATSGYSPSGTRSVESGRSIEEIAAERDTRWMPPAPDESGRARSSGREVPTAGAASRRGAAAARAGSSRRTSPAAGAVSSKRTAPASGRRAPVSGTDPFPAPFRPMLAQLVTRPFNRQGWLFEVKWDGVRALAFIRRRGASKEAVLYSRSLRRLNAQFPEIVEALSTLEVDSAILDGEIIAPDERGQPSFVRLQQRLHREAGPPAPGEIPVAYAVFDCLYLQGRDLRSRPFAERRRVLESLALPAAVIRGDAVPEQGLSLYEAVRQHGLEGVVAKNAAGPYRPGVRSPDWQKVKVRRTIDAVVGGFTRGKGHRAGSFGALVLGQYDPQTGSLVHIGQTGGGFTDAELRRLWERLRPLVTKTCPFGTRPSTLTPATWVRPEVVVEVEYGEHTPDGVLRFPVFLRVRDDVATRDVRLEPVTSAQGPVLPGAAAPRQAPAPESARSRNAPPDAAHAPDASARQVASAGTARRKKVSPPGAATRKSAGLPAGLVFTNLDKVFFPELGHTKGDVIEFYRRIAPYILPHLVDRPLTLRRFPDGIHGNDFFQKDVPDAPPFVRTERIWSDQGDRDIRQVIGSDEASLLWLAQMGCIEMHAWYSRIALIRGRPRPAMSFGESEQVIAGSVLNYPDFVVFDIDPFLFPEGKTPVRRHGEFDPDYSRRGFEAARQAALWLGEALGGLGLRSFLKTSGKTGLHVFVPIVRRYTYAQTHAFAKTAAEWLVRRHPDELTTAWAVRDRVGKVFMDYNQNVRGKTLASIYSLRPVPEATVSVPVTWEELRAGFDPLRWTLTTVFDRLARVGDLWAKIMAAGQSLDVTVGAK